MSYVKERGPETKTLALPLELLNGASRMETYSKSETFQQAKELHNQCMIYATAYNEIMLMRLEKEKPEFYAENNLNKGEMVAHLTNNMCLPYTKYKSKVFRDRTVEIKEEQHLTEEIRRLYNGGDRFHPYV